MLHHFHRGRQGKIVSVSLALLAAGFLFFGRGAGTFNTAPTPHGNEDTATASAVAPLKGKQTLRLPQKTFDATHEDLGDAGIRAFANISFDLERVEQLRSPAVQRRLGLDPEQKRQVQPLFDQAEQLSQTIRQVPADRMEQELKRLYVPAADKYRGVLDEVLSEEQQFGLFRQVLKQQQGALGLLMPGVADELRLLPEQQQRIETMIAGNWESVDWANVGLLEIPRLIRLAREERAAAENLLSPSQKRRWHELLDIESRK